jgi:hypothetical protein
VPAGRSDAKRDNPQLIAQRTQPSGSHSDEPPAKRMKGTRRGRCCRTICIPTAVRLSTAMARSAVLPVSVSVRLSLATRCSDATAAQSNTKQQNQATKKSLWEHSPSPVLYRLTLLNPVQRFRRRPVKMKQNQIKERSL